MNTTDWEVQFSGYWYSKSENSQASPQKGHLIQYSYSREDCYTVIAPWYVYYPLPFTFKGRTNLSVILKPIVWQTSSHSTLGHNGLWNHLCYRSWNPQRHCTRGTKLSTETQRNLFLREEGRGVVKLQIINLKFLFCADFGNKVL